MIPAETVRAIFTSPLGTQSAARQFGVAMSTINKIRERKIRRSVTEGLERCKPLDRESSRCRAFTLREAEQIRQLHSHGIYTGLELAGIYGAGDTTIYAIIRGATYKVARE